MSVSTSYMVIIYSDWGVIVYLDPVYQSRKPDCDRSLYPGIVRFVCYYNVHEFKCRLISFKPEFDIVKMTLTHFL